MDRFVRWSHQVTSQRWPDRPFFPRCENLQPSFSAALQPAVIASHCLLPIAVLLAPNPPVDLRLNPPLPHWRATRLSANYTRTVVESQPAAGRECHARRQEAGHRLAICRRLGHLGSRPRHSVELRTLNIQHRTLNADGRLGMRLARPPASVCHGACYTARSAQNSILDLTPNSPKMSDMYETWRPGAAARYPARIARIRRITWAVYL